MSSSVLEEIITFGQAIKKSVEDILGKSPKLPNGSTFWKMHLHALGPYRKWLLLL